jgi:hypothetical protein
MEVLRVLPIRRKDSLAKQEARDYAGENGKMLDVSVRTLQTALFVNL